MTTMETEEESLWPMLKYAPVDAYLLNPDRPWDLMGDPCTVCPLPKNALGRDAALTWFANAPKPSGGMFIFERFDRDLISPTFADELVRLVGMCGFKFGLGEGFAETQIEWFRYAAKFFDVEMIDR